MKSISVKKRCKPISCTLLMLWMMIFAIFLSGCVQQENIVTQEIVNTEANEGLNEDLPYYSAEDVALYLHTFGKLPMNFLTKSEAQDLGWISEKGNLWDVTEKAVIGGDRFGNREGLLPDAKGRIWFECDVNYEGGYRNAYRLVYSNDGLIYYTEDHYKTFEKWYE